VGRWCLAKVLPSTDLTACASNATAPQASLTVQVAHTGEACISIPCCYFALDMQTQVQKQERACAPQKSLTKKACLTYHSTTPEPKKDGRTDMRNCSICSVMADQHFS